MSDKTMEQAAWQEVIYQIDQVVMHSDNRYKILTAIKEWGLERYQQGADMVIKNWFQLGDKKEEQ